MSVRPQSSTPCSPQVTTPTSNHRPLTKKFTSAAVVVITRETNYNLAIQPVSPRRLFGAARPPGRVPWIPGADLSMSRLGLG
jgi:hypothetical protein